MFDFMIMLAYLVVVLTLLYVINELSGIFKRQAQTLQIKKLMKKIHEREKRKEDK